MSELLLELFSEEIPARMQARAAADLLKLVQDGLLAAGYMPDGAKAFATPRRLALVVTGLAVAQADRVEERKGPKVGAPEKALAGFLKSAGLSSVEQCQIKPDPKGDFYLAITEVKGRPTAEVIAELVPDVMRKFPWPKSMRWGDGEMRWVRPLHSILCCFDGEIVDFEIAGLRAGDVTYGHRFMAGEAIQVRNFEKYETALKRAKVILDADERKERILGEAKSLCQTLGLELIEDEGLLNEVAGLAEYPVPLMAGFDKKFLTVPDEVLIASMRGHQKYFSVRDPKTGRLANKFVCVCNIEAPDGGKAMRVGYERVLTARLSDAWFLYNQDLKTPLEEHAQKLENITFFEGLGTTADKVERVAALAREIAASVGADADLAERAARLCKADLVTGMVGEFPELQGLMGWYYAKVQGEDAAVADAIRDHYKPAGQNDDVPTAPVSVAVALADKIDTLKAFWGVGEIPTGSKDPFALRRATIGSISLILENSLRISLLDFTIQNYVGYSFNTKYENEPVSQPLMKHFISKYFYNADEVPADIAMEQNIIRTYHNLLSFFHDRLKVYLRDKGFKHDHVDAVRIRPDGALEDDLVLIVKKLEALSATLKTEDGANLIAAYKRAGNILKKDAEAAAAQVDSNKLEQAEEKALFTALEKAEKVALPALEKEDFAAAMGALATLRAPLDAFFEKVTVNADDTSLRANRLALLKQIIVTCDQVADLSKIEG